MEITTWYLEQTDPARLRPAGEPAVPVAVTRAEVVSPELNRYLYTAVGGDWYWVDRLPWTWRQWHEWLDRPGVETWLATVRGTPAGYVELDGSTGDEVEIVYFGLLPAFVGQGIGGRLLTRALERSWELGPRRVHVHTCSVDGPAALANYRARGMTLYRTEVEHTDLPEHPPGPWPGAR